MIPLLQTRGLPAGTLIDGWQVVRTLGAGGFGAVLLVEKNGKPHALKFALHREASRDDKRTHARALREVALLLMLHHPNILQPRAYGQWPDPHTGNVYLVTDYVEGWTLAEWVERTHPTARELIRIFRKLAMALAYLHARGVLHRDLKPSNVLIRKSDGEPLLIDFGCAIHAHAEDLTDIPIPPGTERYRAPEVWRFYREHRHQHGVHYAFQVADELFALGVMLHELLTLSRPTQEDARPLINGFGEVPVSPRRQNPRVPEALSDLVMDLLAREPSSRPESAEAVERELAELEGHLGPEYAVPLHLPSEQRAPSEEKEDQVARPPVPSRWRGALVVGSVVAAVVLIATLTLWPTPPPFLEEDLESRAMKPPAEAMLPPEQGVASVPIPTAVQKEGSTVTNTPPDASTSASTPRPHESPRTVHSARFLAWCKSFAILGTMTAVATGCPGAQVRPEPFECPRAVWESMRKTWGWGLPGGDGIWLVLDDRYRSIDVAWLQSGPVVGVVEQGNEGTNFQQEVSKKPVPVGTRFFGHLWVVPERYDGDAGYVIVRYDRVQFPNGENAPVCLLVGFPRKMPVRALKNGKGEMDGPYGEAVVVPSWQPQRP